MKKIILSLALITTTLVGCNQSKNNNQTDNQTDQDTTLKDVELEDFDFQPIQNSNIKVDPSVFADESNFFDNKNKLNTKIDFNIDISKLSYQQLYYYKAYVYATHGFWFKDIYLNQFFNNNSDWYFNKSYEQYDSYSELWDENYEDAIKSIKLSAEEQNFVDRISAKMAEMEKNKTIEDNGLKLNNLALALNRFQISNGKPMNKKLATLLSQNNIAFEPSPYEQLFQLYEDNDYDVMPSFVTTDLYLQAYHMYFSYILKSLENNEFTDKIYNFMEAMHAVAMQYENSSAAGADVQNAKQLSNFVATFYAIGIKLLKNKDVSVPQAFKDQYNTEISNIEAFKDNISPLLQTQVAFNYSLFKPRGHYTRNNEAKAYFKTMMWLQTAYFEMDNQNAVNRAIAMAYFFNNLDSKSKTDCLDVYNMLTFLMGVPDNVAIIDLAQYINKQFAGVDIVDLVKTDNLNKITTWLNEKFKTANRIKPKIQVSCAEKLNFMPQRYQPDNEILSNMADPTPNAERAFPTGLDVFDAFGIKTASALLDTFYTDSTSWNEYTKYRTNMKKLFTNFDGFNNTSYNKWIESLISLQKIGKNYPDFMKTPAYQLRNLNTALASMAELKHDAILYSEQPMMAECGDGGDDLPEPILVGYVEPNLIFWNKLKESVEHLTNILKNNNVYNNDLASKNHVLLDKIDFCIDVTKKELNGENLSTQDFNTIRTIGSSIEYFTLSVINNEETPDTWSTVNGTDHRVAVVCDVYTRNVVGCKKNGILYQATGNPNIIYALVEINGQLYITRGATFSYYEFVRPLGDRLTDEQWQQMIDKKQAPSQPKWFVPLINNSNKPTPLSQWFLYSSGC